MVGQRQRHDGTGRLCGGGGQWAASSVRFGEQHRAAFGEPFPASVDDSTPLRPKSFYGAHKALMEQWLATLSRRGELDAISLRLSGVVARPRGPSGMKSAFLSDDSMRSPPATTSSCRCRATQPAG